MIAQDVYCNYDQIMKPLSQIIRKNGFTYTQVCRGEKSCFYAQGVSEIILGYEVFLIKITPSHQFKGKLIDAHERFPHNEAFGHWAWTFGSYDKALGKFHELEAVK
jgi:hypothetical protein